jgi:hypothetical protein
MAKSGLVEKHSLSIEGVLNCDEANVIVDIEEIGEKSLYELLQSFNGQNVKINVGFSNNIEE